MVLLYSRFVLFRAGERFRKHEKFQKKKTGEKNGGDRLVEACDCLQEAWDRLQKAWDRLHVNSIFEQISLK